MSFGETRNVIFNRCVFESLHWVMLGFWRIDMREDWTKSSQCCTKCVWFSKRLSQIYPMLQQMSGRLTFSTIRHNVYLIQFTSPKWVSAPIGYHRFGSRYKTVQYNPRCCYMQTRRPTHPTIFLPVIFYAGSQLPIINANILSLK